LVGFRNLGQAFIVFSLLNLAIFTLISLHPPLLRDLWLSDDRPWGILTSVFTHADPDHIVSNLLGFVLASGLFAVVSAVNSVEGRRRWSRVFLWLVFLSGFVANVIQYPWLLWHPDFNSWGASGIVYGAFGVLLAASLRSVPAHLHVIAREHRRWTGKRRRRRLFKFDRGSLATLPGLVCLAVVTSFLLSIFTNPGEFLGVGPGVNVLAHGLGFLIGFLGATALFSSRLMYRK
jgi:membrane associated rhomboid family serine protease